MSRVKERSSRGLQYAIVQGARIGDRGGSPCGERWYDIEGSPVYTTPMRERGIEPRSLPWRGSGLPLTDSRNSLRLGRRAGKARRGRGTSTGAKNANALPLRHEPRRLGGNRTLDLSLEVSPVYTTPMRHPRVERGLAVWRTAVQPSHPCRDAAARIRTGIPSPRTRHAFRCTTAAMPSAGVEPAPDVRRTSMLDRVTP